MSYTRIYGIWGVGVIWGGEGLKIIVFYYKEDYELISCGRGITIFDQFVLPIKKLKKN